jgi:hypothetical protein
MWMASMKYTDMHDQLNSRKSTVADPTFPSLPVLGNRKSNGRKRCSRKNIRHFKIYVYGIRLAAQGKLEIVNWNQCCSLWFVIKKLSVYPTFLWNIVELTVKHDFKFAACGLVGTWASRALFPSLYAATLPCETTDYRIFFGYFLVHDVSLSHNSLPYEGLVQIALDNGIKNVCWQSSNYNA